MSRLPDLLNEIRELLEEPPPEGESPDETRARTGRCPAGFNVDPDSDKCKEIAKPAVVTPGEPPKTAPGTTPEKPPPVIKPPDEEPEDEPEPEPEPEEPDEPEEEPEPYDDYDEFEPPPRGQPGWLKKAIQWLARNLGIETASDDDEVRKRAYYRIHQRRKERLFRTGRP